MNPVHVKVDYSQVRFIAVGACQTSYGNYHTGVAYRDASGRLMFFHKAFHYETKTQPIEEAHQELGGPLFCVVPVVEEERARAIAAFWEMIANEGEQIAYALQDDPNALFDPNTGRLALPNGRGLTCSTFVLVWAIAYTNLGLRFPAERVNELLAHRLPAILATHPLRSQKSSAYNGGYTEALRAGNLKASRRCVLAVGRHRLGDPPAKLPAALETITSLDRLEQLAARVLKAARWREALAPN